MSSLIDSDSAKMQKWLLGTEDLAGGVIEFAKQLDFETNLVNLVVFVHEVFQILTIRQNITEKLIDLIAELFKHSSEGNVFSNLPRLLMNEFTQPPTSDTVRFKIIYIRFMLKLCKHGVIEMTQLTNIIADYVKFPNHYVSLFLFLAPYLDEVQLAAHIDTINSFPPYNPSLMKLCSQIKELRADNWKLQREYAEFGCPKGTLEYAIRIDDVELLKTFKLPEDSLVSDLPLYQVSFEVTDCTLAQAAASFASVNCLKYLMSINSPLEAPAGKNNGLFTDYAIASCCPEIEAMATGVIDPTTAVIYRRVDILDRIPNIDVQELAYVCIDFASTSCFLWCLEHGAMKKDEYGLMRSVKLGHLAFIKFFIEQGTPITYKDETGNLYNFAARGGHIITLKLLHELNCPGFDEPNSKKETPFYEAVFNKYIEAAVFLESIGADIKTTNYHNLSPTHAAAEGGAIDILKWLKEKNSLDVNARDLNGNTPLAYAAHEGQYNAVEFLINNGADINLANQLKQTPICIALYELWFGITVLIAKQPAASTITKRILGKAAEQKTPFEKLLVKVLDSFDEVKAEEIEDFFNVLISVVSVFGINNIEEAEKISDIVAICLKKTTNAVNAALKFFIDMADLQMKTKNSNENVKLQIASKIVAAVGKITLSSEMSSVQLALDAIDRLCQHLPKFMQKNINIIGKELENIDTVNQTIAFDRIIEMASVVDYEYAFECFPALIAKCSIAEDESLHAVATLLYETAEEEMRDSSIELQVIHGLNECFQCEEYVPDVDKIAAILSKRIIALYDKDIDKFTMPACEFAFVMKSYNIPVIELFKFVYSNYNSTSDITYQSSVLECWATIGDVQQQVLREVIQEPIKVTMELNEEAKKAVPGIAEHAFDSACVTIAAFKDQCTEEILCELVSTYINTPFLLKDDPTVYLSDIFLDIEEKAAPAARNFLQFAITKLQPLDTTIKVIPIILSSSADALRVCSKESREEFKDVFYKIVKEASENKPHISSKEDCQLAFSMFQSIAIGFETLAELYFPDKIDVSGKPFLSAVSTFNKKLLEYRGISLDVLVSVCDMMETLAKKSSRRVNVALNKAANIKILEHCMTHPELKETAKYIISLIRTS